MSSRLVLLLGVLLVVIASSATTTAAFEWHLGGRPNVDRKAIAGLWKLTTSPKYPMKEFTVYPKKPPPTQVDNDKDKADELFLMLKEDGSFTQYDMTFGEDEVDADASWKTFRKRTMAHKSSSGGEEEIVTQLHSQLLQGTWDFRDGKLLLAADRPAAKTQSGTTSSSSTSDTLLTGRVVVNYETRLQDNPALVSSAERGQPTAAAASSSSSINSGGAGSTSSSTKAAAVALDAHLSVPMGSVKAGKFFYPKNHPSFFEQPMYKPIKRGTVVLRQILGSLNTALGNKDDQLVEKFKCSDFYNKTFLLTSHPIGYRRPTGRPRWSIRQNKMVYDPPNKEAAKAAEEAENRPQNIRVMQVQFHPNNTFSTVAGLGESILRGKFDVIGQDRDQLWMQIWRFGFGRSVSGSVFSEGRMLTQDDAKCYWGTIQYEQPVAPRINATAKDGAALLPISEKAREEKASRLEVDGSVLVGLGIEPTPEARFIMREVSGEEEASDEEEEDEEDEDDPLPSLDFRNSDIPKTDGIDWTTDDTFQ